MSDDEQRQIAVSSQNLDHAQVAATLYVGDQLKRIADALKDGTVYINVYDAGRQ